MEVWFSTPEAALEHMRRRQATLEAGKKPCVCGAPLDEDGNCLDHGGRRAAELADDPDSETDADAERERMSPPRILAYGMYKGGSPHMSVGSYKIRPFGSGFIVARVGEDPLVADTLREAVAIAKRGTIAERRRK